MEKIFYDSYEQRIRTTVWAQFFGGNIEIHKYVRGIYVDDIFGIDEEEKKLVVLTENIPSLLSVANVHSIKELFEFLRADASVRSGYEKIKDWFDINGICFDEETV